MLPGCCKDVARSSSRQEHLGGTLRGYCSHSPPFCTVGHERSLSIHPGWTTSICALIRARNSIAIEALSNHEVPKWLAILVLAVAACSAPAAPSLAPATFEEFATNACDAFEAMFRAVGNPDAGTDSELSKALEEAVQRGDPAEAGRLAEAITVELESGRQAASRAAAWPPGFAAMSARSLAPCIRGDDRREAPNRREPGWTGPSGGVRGGRRRGRLDADAPGSPGSGAACPSNAPPHECDGVPMSW